MVIKQDKLRCVDNVHLRSAADFFYGGDRNSDVFTLTPFIVQFLASIDQNG